ncbi:RNase P subunit p30-domain-containing protein [Echria macrotheca]|uniref:RNase P subunit p30-domain-containing protein n=1 Tax=Echria macrotheca TaxID=438768 RepID=A0AAJ0BBH2_9PEZI|nr:RNase P subunit p30-domain-containing protein [Echria macrotheca]
MLYDLNIAWSPTTPPAELDRTLKFAKTLGYDVVALNHTIQGPIPTTALTNPIPELTPSPSVPRKPSPKTPPTDPGLPTVLRRATLTITDPATTNYRLADHARAYDLLAVRPTTEKAFAWACSSTTEIPALISLDLTSFLGWHIHHRTAMAAVHRGSRFEICYSQVLGGDNKIDARQRANFIGNVMGLLRATKGRGVVVSSEARSALGLRGPADVVNLLAVWGLGPEKGMEAIGAGARLVVVNEGLKRRGFRGVVDIVQTAGESAEIKAAREAAEKEREGGAGKGKKKKGQQQQQQQQQQQGQGQKRKSGESGDGTGAEGQGAMSKRQAKKLKREALQATG